MSPDPVDSPMASDAESEEENSDDEDEEAEKEEEQEAEEEEAEEEEESADDSDVLSELADFCFVSSDDGDSVGGDSELN